MKIVLNYRIESTDSKVKISPVEGELTHGFKIDKKTGEETIVEPKSLAQAVNFLMTALRAIVIDGGLDQFKRKYILKVNGYKVSDKLLKCVVWDYDKLFPTETAMICATLAALDESLTQQWGRECNLYGDPKDKLDKEDISDLSSQMVKKVQVFSKIRENLNKKKVWNENETKLALAYREMQKAERKLLSK